MASVDTIQRSDLQLYEKIGSGHYGGVQRAVDLRNGRELAIKYCKRGSDNVLDLKKLEKEATRVREMHHDNIIRMFGFVCHGKDFIGVAFEYMAGGNLTNAMMRLKNKRKPVVWSLKYRWLAEISSALSYMHQQSYIHKDIKAQNVLLNQDLHAKLADFELCRAEATQALHPELINYATLSHLAPEYLENMEELKWHEPSFDVYSFGITMFQILSEEESAYDSANDPVLMERVKKNGRPDITKIRVVSSESPVVEGKLIPLMKRCWDQTPQMRPTAADILKICGGIYTPEMKDKARAATAQLAPFALLEKDDAARNDTGGQYISDGDTRESTNAAVVSNANVNIGNQVIRANPGTSSERPRNWIKLSEEEAVERLDLAKNGIRLRDENAIASDEELKAMAKLLGTDTKWLARCLLIKEGELQTIEYDHRSFGLEEINYQMLLKWRNRQNTPSCKWLATACLSLSRNDLIEILT